VLKKAARASFNMQIGNMPGGLASTEISTLAATMAASGTQVSKKVRQRPFLEKERFRLQFPKLTRPLQE
jgi:hypothetical protein